MPNDDLMGQDEIEQLLSQAKPGATGESAPPADAPAASDPPAAASDSAPPAASADDDKLLAQDDIEKLLAQAGKKGAAPEEATQAVAEQPPAVEAPVVDVDALAQGDVDYLLNQAEKALASLNSDAERPLPPEVTSFRLEEFSGAPASAETATLDLIRDVELDLKIELGRTHMYLEDVLRLRKGTVVPLDKLAGDPVDIYVNGRLIARGEVLVLNDNFCVRVAELIAGTHSHA